MNLKTIYAAIAAATVTFAAPAFAATGLAFSNLGGAEYDTAGVFFHGDVSYTATTDDGLGFDQVMFRLWDDGVIKYETTFSLAVGNYGTFHVETSYPGLVGTAAPGIGLYLYDAPTEFSETYIDPFYLPHYSDPSQCRTDCGSPAIPEPETYALMLLGLGAVGVAARRKTKR
jgi:hypothetical protein